MRVRRASAHARRFTLNSSSIAVVTIVTASLALPAASAGPQATAQDPAKPTVAAATSSGLRVSNLAIEPVEAADASALSPKALEMSAAPSGRLLAHVRQPAVHGFSMLGVTWDHTTASHPITVEYRTRNGGTWGDWSELEPDLDGGPLTQQAGHRVPRRHRAGLGRPLDGRRGRGVRHRRRASGARGEHHRPGQLADRHQRRSRRPRRTTRPRPGTFPSIPHVITRAAVGSRRVARRRVLGPEVRPHLQGRRSCTTPPAATTTRKSESAALVRGIYAYHTQSRGWCDIGYNFLIDRFGTIYEGRDGGIRQPVRGAHSGDYNVNTTGISLMGNFDVA